MLHNGEPVNEGETFEPKPGYTVRYIRTEADRIVLRDVAGEFTRRIIHRPSALEPRPAGKPRLGERRTVIEEVPDARPMVGAAIYQMSHQICVPGGWEDVTTRRLSAPEHEDGTYGPRGELLASTWLRQAARQLFDDANKKLAKHPIARLDKLVTKVRLQEGTGEVGGWDDPGTAMEIVELLEKALII